MSKPILHPGICTASRKLLIAFGLGVVATGPGRAQTAQPAAAQVNAMPSRAAPRGPAAALGGFNVDPRFDPCTDFADYVNARWNESHPVPADETTWNAFRVLQAKSLADQRHILEAAAKDASTDPDGSLESKLGRLYAAGMDASTIEALGYAPIKPQLARIAAIRKRVDITRFLDQSFDQGYSYVFRFKSGPDFRDASRQIGFVTQAGLGLPTRDYYFQPKYAAIRRAYLDYIRKSLVLIGTRPSVAGEQARQVLAFETALAKASLAPTELRELDNEYHFVSVAEADEISPHFSWKQFFEAQGIESGRGFSMSQPRFIEEFDRLLATAPIGQWRAYLRFHLVSSASPYLDDAFARAYFDFYEKTLHGQPEMKPRWKRVIEGVNDAMGMALGQLYVAKYFPPSSKARAEKLASDVLGALKHRIEKVGWMSPATKARALEKWALILPKIGYPDSGEWRNWSGLAIAPDRWYADVQAAARYNYHHDIGKIGSRTDRREWTMTPQTVNAYYSHATNTINFPAAILQPPFFFPNGDDAVNFGGIGYVMGHESTHGFDDRGSQFDGHGNRVNWWTPADRKKFNARAAALIQQFNAYTPIPGRPDLHVNGKLTLSENIADLGGLNIAYDALQAAMGRSGQETTGQDASAADRRFFLSSARIFEGSTRKQSAEVKLNVDPHAPDKIRAFAAATNTPAFAKAFQCRPGSKMVHTGAKLVRIW